MSVACAAARQKAPAAEDARVKKICFVCTGNTCRSPMAAAVANAPAQEALLALPEGIRELALPKLVAYSAGLAANAGDPIAANAVLALEEAGVPALPGLDYHRHVAHTLTQEEADGYDCLVALSRRHAMALLMEFPASAQKILCFEEDIPDPFGGDLAAYRACLSSITAGVKQLFFAGDGK